MQVDLELGMIKDSDKWPGDILCLKKRPSKEEKSFATGYAAFGVITDNHEPVTIYLRDMENPELDFTKTKEYSTFEDMLKDGWIVD